MELHWSKLLSVGNAIIDSEHRNLINLVNATIRAIETRDSSELTLAFEQLERALCVHFENEEKIAQAVGFDLSELKMAQHYVRKELQLLKAELVGGNGLRSENAVEHHIHFLKNWMIADHIFRVDMQMSPALRSYEYEFWPNSVA